jgi:hypothetical protein
MLSDHTQRHPLNFAMQEIGPRFGVVFAELWQDWFETMSQVAYQAHRACEFLAENGAPVGPVFGPVNLRSSRGASDGGNGAVDLDKLRQCLQSLDPTQAARVVHAVQTMQAMEAMLKKQRSRGNEAEEATW